MMSNSLARILIGVGIYAGIQFLTILCKMLSNVLNISDSIIMFVIMLVLTVIFRRMK